MDQTKKYLHLEYNGKNALEIAKKIAVEDHLPLYAVKKIREIFRHLSLLEAKEIMVIATSEYKSLYDYQESIFPELEDLE